MASAADLDGLVLLRQSISSGAPFIPSASADASATEVPLSQATNLRFPNQNITVPIDGPTRFVSHDKPVDLRSIYFAWLNREVAIPEYNASATKLNDELSAAGSSGKVQNLGFIERLDLITWLEGASEESEYIKPLANDKDAATTDAATTAKTGAVNSASQARSGRGTMDPRLVGIYNGERKMGDRNTVLRGAKPTVCLVVKTIRDLSDLSRTFLMFVNLPHHSFRRNLSPAPPASPPTHHSHSTRRFPRGDQIPSFSYHLRPLL